MAGSSLFALIDDVATVLDDVALLAKAAAKKTSGVLGDDLALNAQQVAGVQADRELPVVWAVAKGSARNKLILVPAALTVSAIAPWLVAPLLMVGGAFLCFEGFEKVAHRFLHPKGEARTRHAEHAQANADPAVDLVAFEKEKIKGAVRTDFVLSAEIVAISLGTVASAPFSTRAAVLGIVAVLMTVGVYGVVALIVKLDDIGLHLNRKQGPGGLARFQRLLGAGVLASASRLMKLLSVAGTVAMFLVGGGILVHGIPGLHHLAESLESAIHLWSAALAKTVSPLLNGLTGVLAGALVLVAVALVKRWLPGKKDRAAS